jgi:polar amino acid transport system permease protein
LLIIYTGLPLFGIRFSVVQAALLGLSLNEAAYLSETVRAGILSVAKGQREAALALGLRRVQAFRLVVWPQALRIIIPPLGNSVNGLLKTTSVASVISMEELLRRTQILIQERFLVLELFVVAALYYLLMTSAWDLVQRRLEKRYGRGHALEAADRR